MVLNLTSNSRLDMEINTFSDRIIHHYKHNIEKQSILELINNLNKNNRLQFLNEFKNCVWATILHDDEIVLKCLLDNYMTNLPNNRALSSVEERVQMGILVDLINEIDACFDIGENCIKYVEQWLLCDSSTDDLSISTTLTTSTSSSTEFSDCESDNENNFEQ